MEHDQVESGVKMTVYLEGINGEYAGKRIALGYGRLSIGRGSTNRLRLQAPNVSRQHAVIYFSGGRYTIQDYNSRLGTLVNGKSVKHVQLRSGDVITIGGSSFRFEQINESVQKDQKTSRKKVNDGLIILALVFSIAAVWGIFSLYIRSHDESQMAVSIVDQGNAIQRLANETGASVNYVEKNGVIRHLSFNWSDATQQNTRLLVDDFLSRYADIFGIGDSKAQLTLIDSRQDQNGNTFTYRQIYQGVPVYGSALAFHVSTQGVLDWYEGGYIPDLSISVSPKINSEQALQIIQDQHGGEEILVVEEPELMIYDSRVFGVNGMIGTRLVWDQTIMTETSYLEYLIDANTGEIIQAQSALMEDLSYEIFDAHNQWWKIWMDNSKHPTLVYDEKGSKGAQLLIDKEAKELSEHISMVYDYFSDNFNWSSFDGNDSSIEVYINYKNEDSKFANAWWDGNKKIIYFNDSMVGSSVDVFAHEFTHAVTQNLIGYTEIPETGELISLLESFSDIFAAYIDQADPWRICVEDCVNSFPVDLIRNLKDPESQGYPLFYKDRLEPGEGKCVEEEADYNCGHVNSTIHTHAVYLFTSKVGIDKSSQVVFNALKSGMITQDADFASASRAIYQTCVTMSRSGTNGVQMEDCDEISKAYEKVGIGDKLITVEPMVENPMPTVSVQQTILQTMNSETVLVMDVSGSMAEFDAGGSEKMMGAQRASDNLIDVIISEQEAAGSTLVHQIGLVTFSVEAYTISSLSEEIDAVQDAIWRLTPEGGTAMAAGLKKAIAQFDATSNAQQMIILLSDGMPNIGLDFISYFFDIQEQETIQQEIIDLANQAGEKGICVYTVGFGNPQADPETDAYIDEIFLRQIAQVSGCGQYYSAQESIQLANVFVELRHASMGTLLMKNSGTIQQDQLLNLGDVDISVDYEQMMFTLNWPGSNLVPVLTDPKDKTVDENYPGVTIDSQETITTIIIDRPRTGNWNVSVYGQDVPEGATNYNALMSTRGLIEEKEPPIWLWIGLVIVAISGVTIAILSHSFTKRNKPDITKHQLQKAYLQIMNGEQTGEKFLLNDQVLVGRGSKCEIVLRDISVSRMHAIVFNKEGDWFIKDQGSKAGVSVNGRLREIAQLQTEDTIKLGHCELLFLLK